LKPQLKSLKRMPVSVAAVKLNIFDAKFLPRGSWGLLRNHVVAFIERLQEPRDLGWIVLDVGIHGEEEMLVLSHGMHADIERHCFSAVRRNLMVVPRSSPLAISLMIFQEASNLPY
jgi:hypothetical protein